MKYLLAAEVKNLIGQLEGETRLCALLQWRAGLRISEALAVTPDDIDYEANTITVQHGKGDRRRTIELHDELAVTLKSTNRPRSGKRYIRRHRSTMLRRYAAAGIDGTHTLRHSAARHWLNGPYSLNDVQLMLGHSNMSTTMVYLELVAPRSGGMKDVS